MAISSLKPVAPVVLALFAGVVWFAYAKGVEAAHDRRAQMAPAFAGVVPFDPETSIVGADIGLRADDAFVAPVPARKPVPKSGASAVAEPAIAREPEVQTAAIETPGAAATTPPAEGLSIEIPRLAASTPEPLRVHAAVAALAPVPLPPIAAPADIHAAAMREGATLAIEPDAAAALPRSTWEALKDGSAGLLRGLTNETAELLGLKTREDTAAAPGCVDGEADCPGAP